MSPPRSELSFPEVKQKWNKLLPVLFIVVFAVSRIPGLMPQNFSAAYAFAFCAGVYFSKRLSWWLPLVVMLATDIGLNFYYQHNDPDHSVWDSRNLANLAFNYAAYAVLIFLGRRFKPQSSFVALLGGGILGAILFYLITNTGRGFSIRSTIPNTRKTWRAGSSRSPRAPAVIRPLGNFFGARF